MFYLKGGNAIFISQNCASVVNKNENELISAILFLIYKTNCINMVPIVEHFNPNQYSNYETGSRGNCLWGLVRPKRVNKAMSKEVMGSTLPLFQIYFLFKWLKTCTVLNQKDQRVTIFLF